MERGADLTLPPVPGGIAPSTIPKARFRLGSLRPRGPNPNQVSATGLCLANQASAFSASVQDFSRQVVIGSIPATVRTAGLTRTGHGERSIPAVVRGVNSALRKSYTDVGRKRLHRPPQKVSHTAPRGARRCVRLSTDSIAHCPVRCARRRVEMGLPALGRQYRAWAASEMPLFAAQKPRSPRFPCDPYPRRGKAANTPVLSECDSCNLLRPCGVYKGMQKVSYAETKTARNGKQYLRIGIDGKGFYSCFDTPLPTVNSGDVIDYDSIDESKGILRGVRVGNGEVAPSGGSSYRYDNHAEPHLSFLSYAKDILLSELTTAETPSDAGRIACQLMETFGSNRSGSMKASYAKDLICSGWKAEDAIKAVQDMELELVAQLQFGNNGQ